MIKPICLDYEPWQIHGIRPEELKRHKQLIKEIHQVLTDQQTLQYLPEKRIHALAEAESWLSTAILNYYCAKCYTHLITERSTGKLVGMIDIIPPETSREHYELPEHSYFIEFYLNSNHIGKNLMSSMLPLVLNAMQEQGIKSVAAVVNRQNHAAKKVLMRSGFSYDRRFDILQDLYIVTLN
ncbi:Protein N-acetyltransferase, RimJ/RimL family [Mucilaginibacter gossypiicola]|uniref:Protein N-acetyltransferase, RimJ/RimL family n=1 Tax=Mucilaginibacter gossypiicola TaxID=551995 RepID=A0A1H8M112_9SPHI|nr:GNAT family N-acetyltransferase [Mucilaginibacter gossypiicola]SEO11104.1 Protein N-acetyltransferase, RimJ/RimL family [Mucilaginibacter gossypiicola]